MKKKFLIFSLVLLSVYNCRSASWGPLGVGLGGQVNAMTVYNGSLYAGGTFSVDGGSNSVLRIARWNGSSWVSVGNGFNGDVNALAVFNGDLYAAGSFTFSGTTSLDRIAKWNGTSWSAVGTGLNNFAKCLYVFNNELYVGGAFTMAGTTTVNRITKWNGSVWSALGTGVSAGGIVNTITDYAGEIYIGGTFGGNVSKFNGSAWSTVGSLSATEVYCLASWAPNGASSGATYFLYAGGDISVPSQGMVRWNGSSWSSAVQSFTANPGRPHVLLPTYSFLYSGGGFNITVSGHSVKSVAKFQGSFWDSVGTGMDNDVLALTIYNGLLQAGGSFLNADGFAAKCVATRNILIGIDEPNETIISKDFFPNPFIDQATLKIITRPVIDQPVLKVFDLEGREMNPLTELVSFSKFNHEVEYRINRSGLSPGIYFYTLNDLKTIVAAGKFIIQ